jgi:hypothetical protein
LLLGILAIDERITSQWAEVRISMFRSSSWFGQNVGTDALSDAFFQDA